MEDYFLWIIFAILSLLLTAISNFRISFELLNDNVILENIKDSHQSRIEKLLYSRDKINLTVLLATIILSASVALLLYSLLSVGLGWAILICAAALIVLVYLLPSLLALASHARGIFWNVHLVSFFTTILTPLTWPLLKLKPRDRENPAVGSEDQSISLEELSEAVEIVSKSSPNDRKILTGFGWFVDAKVDEIMTHRTEVVAVDDDITFAELKEAFITSRYSRIPVYADDIDSIIGVMYVKDIITEFDNDDFDWREFIRKPIFINDEAFAKDLLILFQERKEHMAIVVDEYGSTQGVVTIEDIIEELVGEIADESDEEENVDYKTTPDGNYIFEGKTTINDFEHIVGLESDDLKEVVGDAETLAGLFIEISHSFPRIGATVVAGNYRLTIVGMDKNRITKIKVVRADES